ncbi:MAG: hypothetical protein EA385_08730 [Salinarimonadaceae bacterium]|nr:MAG: hypothetical protein EA385_08730 [Salinarimonadaceae bacterium]
MEIKAGTKLGLPLGEGEGRATLSFVLPTAANNPIAAANAAPNSAVATGALVRQAMQNAVAASPMQSVAPTVAPSAFVSQAANPLVGSAAEVFNKAGVISITQSGTATLTFETENTDFRNTLVMYKLDAAGNIRSTQVVYPNASMMGEGGKLIPGVSHTQVDLRAGDQIGFAIVPNAFNNSHSRELLKREDGHFALVNAYGHPANLFNDHPGGMNLVHVDKWGAMRPINGEYGNKLFHTTGNQAAGIQTNVDGYDHADQLVDANRGKLLIAMDDRFAPVDADRNSLIFSLDIGRKNARALDAPLIDDRPRTFREMAGADFRANPQEIMAAARMFDKNGDGRLDAQEWAEFAPLLNLGPEHHKYVVGLRGRGDLDALGYMMAKGDANGDGQIDEHEVLEFARRLDGNDPYVIQSFREAAGIDGKLDYEEFIATAEAHDRNLDGLDQEEWNRFAPVLGLTPQDRALFLDHKGCFDVQKFKSVFHLADVDGDGQLSAREVLDLRRLVNEAFGNNDFPR